MEQEGVEQRGGGGEWKFFGQNYTTSMYAFFVLQFQELMGAANSSYAT